MLREVYTEASKQVINGKGDTESWAAQMTPEEFEEKVINGFEEYKQNFLNKLDTHTNGEKNENLEQD